MTIEIRPARAGEMLSMGGIGAYVYAGAFGDEPDNIIATSNNPDWTLCAFVDGQMVSMFSTIPLTMRAAGTAVPMGGISAIGTLPEFRRRGLVRQIMTKAFSDMRERGQSVASLWASQAAIYQRYQFAVSTMQRSYAIDTVDIGFHDGDMGSCAVTRTDIENGFDVIKAIYIEHIKNRICYLHRAKPMWQNNVLQQRSEDGAIHIAVSRDSTGASVGYIIYTVRLGGTHRTRNQVMKIRELVWLTADAYRSLWRFIAVHDLVGTVKWQNAPVDDPAPELFTEPRLLHTQEGEGLLFRIVDVAGALGARGYWSNRSIKIGIEEDRLAPWNSGTFQLITSDQGAEATRIDSTPDIQLSIKSLASLYTGFRSARDLANWNLLQGDLKSIALANEVFATPHGPHCPDHF